MRKTELIAFLFMGLTPSFAQLGIAPQHENGEVIVVNKCGVPVYYVSMGDSGSTIDPILVLKGRVFLAKHFDNDLSTTET
jgi:hypothetical protein